jgi:hypothetical protein
MAVCGAINGTGTTNMACVSSSVDGLFSSNCPMAALLLKHMEVNVPVYFDLQAWCRAPGLRSCASTTACLLVRLTSGCHHFIFSYPAPDIHPRRPDINMHMQPFHQAGAFKAAMVSYQAVSE